MQDKDSEALRNQRRRRKRIARMKSAIVGIIAGWIIISMVLICFLFVRTFSLEKRLSRLQAPAETIPEDATDEPETADTGQAEPTETETGEPEVKDNGIALVSGMDGTDNLAQEGDLHKVYLTFDDGPSERTGEILDALAECQVKATFFVSGKEDEESQALYRRIVDEGHTLGMHSYSNKYSEIYQSKEAFVLDYEKLSDYLYEVTGTRSRYYRFPGGSSNQISNVDMGTLIQYLDEQDVTYCDWNISAGDAASAAYTAEEIVENVTRDVVKYKTSVILLHDSEDKSTTVEAIRPLVEALRAMDASILPIDEDTQVIQYVKISDTE